MYQIDNMAEDISSSDSRYPQSQTVLNLYNSGIPSDIIALQMDISEEEVEKIIESVNKEEREKKDICQTGVRYSVVRFFLS